VIAFACAMSTSLLPALAALVAIRREPRRADGSIAAGCCALTAGLATFIGYVFVTYTTDGGTPSARLLDDFRRSGARDYRTWVVGDNLGGAVFLLGFVLIVGIALGLIAAHATAPGAQVPDPD
jgi:hypothetical protein